MARATSASQSDWTALGRRIFGPNGDLRVLSVAVSGMILLLVHARFLAARVDRTFSVQVSVKSENPATAVFAVEPAAVQVTLRGTHEELASFDPSRLALELSARNVRGEAREELRIRDRNLLGRGDLAISGFEPSSVSVLYDPMVTWNATGRIAQPALEGAPVQGVASVEVPTNATVVVRGSESKLAAFREKRILLPTSPVNVSGKTESFDATVEILVPPDSGISSVEPSTVRVHVSIETIAAPGVVEDDAPLVRVSPAVQPHSAAPVPSATNGTPEEVSGPEADAEILSGEDEPLPAPVPVADEPLPAPVPVAGEPPPGE